MSEFSQDILEAIENAPMFPVSLTRLSELIEKPDTDLAEVIDALETDATLTANILRMANSPAYGGRGAIATLRDAVVRLGLKHVNDLAMASFITSVGEKPMMGYGMGPGELTNHSLMVAYGTEIVTAAWDEPVRHYMFTAGLLVDIGKVALSAFVGVDAQKIVDLANSEGLPFHVAEQRVLGTDHAAVGAELLKRWGLPEPIINATRYHHCPDDAPEKDLVIDAVHVADALTTQCGVGIGGVEGLQYPMSTAVLERHPLKLEQMEMCISEMVIKWQEVNDQAETPGAGGTN